MKKSQIERAIAGLLQERDAIDMAIGKLRDQAAMLAPKKRKAKKVPAWMPDAAALDELDKEAVK